MSYRALLPSLALLLVAPGDARDEDPLTNGDVRSVELSGSSDTRIEHFRIDAAEADAFPLGVARFVSKPDPAGGLRLELDVRFFDEDVRVLHVETLRTDELKLVVREIRARGGRTVLLEWSRDDPVLRAADTFAGEVLRREVDASGGALMPLYLLEQARHGARFEGPQRVFDARSARVETRSITTLSASGDAGSVARTVEARLDDGTLVGRSVFEGERLVELRWQAGGPVARAVERGRYERLLHDSVHRESATGR